MDRITEAEMQTVEGLEEGNRSALLFARRLAAEVRRLRALIVAFCEPDDELDDEGAAIIAEARAIREEQGS